MFLKQTKSKRASSLEQNRAEKGSERIFFHRTVITQNTKGIFAVTLAVSALITRAAGASVAAAVGVRR